MTGFFGFRRVGKPTCSSLGRMNRPFSRARPQKTPGDRSPGGGKVESACKPGSVRLAARQSFLSARRHRLAPATYPGTTRAALSSPYLVLLRVGFTVPHGVGPVRGALLPHPFTLTTRIRRCRSAVCSLLHWPSAHAAQELPGTLPCGARTFLDALACDATVRPTPPPIVRDREPGRAQGPGCLMQCATRNLSSRERQGQVAAKTSRSPLRTVPCAVRR